MNLEPAAGQSPVITVLPPETEPVVPAEAGAVVQVTGQPPQEGRPNVPKVREESDKHKRAFAYWLSLGDERSFEAVAAEFKATPNTVKNWAWQFNWTQRLKDTGNASNAESALQTLLLAAKLKCDQFVENDPETPGRKKLTGLASNAALVEMGKLLLAYFDHKHKVEAARRGGPTEGGRGPTGAVVNVIIQGK
jgi:hypothetical protein